MKINKLHIENFKLFDDLLINFKEKDITVLDGPNGFGKTTVFDAIELLLNGEIRRFSRLSDIYDSRRSWGDKPYSKDQNKPISIKAEFQKGEEEITFARYLDPEEMDVAAHSPDNFEYFKLYQLDDFNDEINSSHLINEDDISDIKDDYLKNFYNLFYYIEQEDSTHFLKESERERKRLLSNLFETHAEEQNLQKIKDAKAIVQKHKNNLEEENEGIADKILQREEEQADLEKRENIEYKDVLRDLSVEKDWNRDDVIIGDKELYEKYISEINSISKFIINKENFLNKLKNAKIEDLTSRKDLIKAVVVLYNFVGNYEDLEERIKKIEDIEYLLNKLDSDDLLENILNKQINLDKIDNYLSIDKESIQDYLDTILQYNNRADEFENLVRELNSSRKRLSSKFEKAREDESISNTECPMCGHDWSTLEDLLKAFKDQEDAYGEMYSGFSEQVNQKLEELKQEHLQSIIRDLELLLNNDSLYIEPDLIEKIKAFEKYLDEVLQLREWFQDENILISEYCHSDLENDIFNLDELSNDLLEFIESQKETIDSDKLESSFSRIFNEYFNESIEKIESINVEELEAKKKYLEFKYFRHNQNELIGLRSKFEELNNKLVSISSTLDRIERIRKEYKSELDAYRDKVIRDIEILFYLYSGRIIQDHQRGLGLFIQEADDGELKQIKFQSNINTSHDALFSLSSGQLTALVLAFSLALNRIYGKANGFVFIDDPVQTMDDINIASFIELLRHELSDKQIILSTHEDDVSMFLRYKFKMYGKTTKRVNVKEEYYKQIASI